MDFCIFAKVLPDIQIVYKVFFFVFKNPTLLNLQNDDGLTPIQEAIGNGNSELVAELLKRGELKLDDAILHAVESGDRAIVDLVMVAMKWDYIFSLLYFNLLY